MKLTKQFFQQEDVVMIAQSLLGTLLYSRIGGFYCCGLVTETEAYDGINDKASHAYGGKLTARTRVMYEPGGISYVYFIYGLHSLFNVVTGKPGNPQAVLIRAIYPIEGIKDMQERRKKVLPFNRFTNGPAKLTQALGIDLSHNAIDLEGDTIWFEAVIEPDTYDIRRGARIGVGYAGEDATLPYRFWMIDPEAVMDRNRDIIKQNLNQSQSSSI